MRSTHYDVFEMVVKPAVRVRAICDSDNQRGCFLKTMSTSWLPLLITRVILSTHVSHGKVNTKQRIKDPSGTENHLNLGTLFSARQTAQGLGSEPVSGVGRV
jgi:hypothetical protein